MFPSLVKVVGFSFQPLSAIIFLWMINYTIRQISFVGAQMSVQIGHSATKRVGILSQAHPPNMESYEKEINCLCTK